MAASSSLSLLLCKREEVIGALIVYGLLLRLGDYLGDGVSKFFSNGSLFHDYLLILLLGQIKYGSRGGR
jgi:hypothetical protein